MARTSTSLVPICAVDAWLMNRLRQVGASESYVTTVTPLAIAAFSVGHSAVGSVAETIRTFAPLVIAAWMAGICEVGVAEVPLVSVPVSPSSDNAASAPPDLTLSEVVKYGLPRFFGITKTLRPVLRPPPPPPPLLDEDEDLLAEGVDEDELPEEHAASIPTASMSTAGPSSARPLVVPVRALTVESFQSGRTEVGADDWPGI